MLNTLLVSAETKVGLIGFIFSLLLLRARGRRLAMRNVSCVRVGGVTLALLLAVLLFLSASVRASPYGQPPCGKSSEQNKENAQPVSDPDAWVLSDLEASRREAFRVVERFVVFGVALIVFAAICVAYVLLSTPSEIKPAKPFDPEKERKATNSRRHLIP